jgi:hypothetical protein
MVMTATRSLSRSVLAASILNALLSLIGLVVSIAPLPQGADAVAQSNDQPPFAALVFGVILGVLGLVGSFGILRGERWGSILTIAVRGIDGLLSVFGVLFAESATLRSLAVLSVVGAALVIYLLLKRVKRPSGAAG